MDKETLLKTIRIICDEKNLSFESVLETIEAALAAAYRKDFGNKQQNIKVKFNLETGESKVYDVKTVVEDIVEEKDNENKEQDSEIKQKQKFNPKTEIQLSDAKKIKPDCKVGDVIEIELEVPAEYGRVAAQTAKQVIIQKLREAERKVQYEEFKEKEGELAVGIVQRHEGNRVLIDMGHVTAIMPYEEQVKSEFYKPGERIKVLVLSVEQTTKGPLVIVSRAHDNFLKKLFEMEIPEIATGVVEIKAIAREAGSRSKIAVYTDDESIDPIGSCVGQRGARIQTIINELNGEKIDIIEWSDDPEKFLINAISPAKAESVDFDDEKNLAIINVPSDQLSLAIGREGQNVRLAVKLTGWDINIREIGGDIVDLEDSIQKNDDIEEGEIDIE